MGLKFIRCEDGSYVYVKNVTRLSVETDTLSDKSKIKAHHNGPSMPFTVADFETRREAEMWLLDLVDRIEYTLPNGRPRRPRREPPRDLM